MNNVIKALNSILGNGADASQITGETTGTKRALHVHLTGDDTTTTAKENLKCALEILEVFIQGTMPDPNWDRMQYSIISDTEVMFKFIWRNVLEFEVTITDPCGQFDVTVEDFELRAFEDDSGWRLTEDDFNREFEVNT